MALSLPSSQVAAVAGRSGGALIASVSVAGSVSPSADCPGRRYHKKGAAVCVYGPVLKSFVSNVGQQESLASSLRSPYKLAQSVNQHQGPYKRVPDNEAHGNPIANAAALFDIEDSGDGCITFKYGAVEDLWDLDRLLEFLSSGAFSSYTVESFVRIVVELFRVPVSYTGQRRMVELLSSQIRLHSNGSPEEMEKTVSQVLAEAASEFLPPSSVGSYSRGSARPYKRFSSRLDKWWKKLDDYLGVGEGSVDFMPQHAFEDFGEYLMQPEGNYGQLNQRSKYEFFQPKFSRVENSNTNTQITWKDTLSPMPWLARPSDRLYIDPPKNMEFVREEDSSAAPDQGDYVAGLDFIMFQSQVDSLEEVLRKTEVEESVQHPDLHVAPLSNNAETLPAASIQAMVEWEQNEAFVTSAVSLPSKHKSRVKVKAKKSAQQTKKKTNPEARSTRSVSKKKSSTEKRIESQLCDMFFGLPISHKCSGVAGFLAMRRNFGGEMLVILNQVAVGFAGVGLAVTLHVVARMLSVNSTFDSSKLFGLIRGAALMWLSAAMQSVRKVMLRLPAGCSVADSKSKPELLCLQRQLRRLSFTAMTVVVLTIVGHGV